MGADGFHLGFSHLPWRGRDGPLAMGGGKKASQEVGKKDTPEMGGGLEKGPGGTFGEHC